MKRIIVIAAALWAQAVLLPASAFAQASDSWQFTAYIYGYLPRVDLKATLVGPGGIPISADTSVSPSEYLQHLKMAFQGALEAHNGSWGALTDVLYLNVGGLNSGTSNLSVGGIGLPAGASTSTSFDMKATVWTLAGTYRLVADPDANLDVLAGARLLDVKAMLGLQLSGNVGPIPLPGWNSPGFPDTSYDAKLASGGVQWRPGKDGSLRPSSSERR